MDFTTFASMLIRVILVCAGLLACVSTQAQSTAHANSLGLRMHPGFLFAHHPDMRHLIERHFISWEADFRRTFSGDKEWHHDYLLPSWGITALWMPLPSEHLGTAIAAFPYYYLPVTKGEQAQLNLKLGAGIGYLSNRFDRVENNKNNAISSRLNVTLQIGWDFRWRLSRRIDWTTGLFFTHFSNGAIRLPNLGLNYTTFSTGLAWKFGEEFERVVRKSAFEKPRGIQWSLFGGFGLKQGRPLQGYVSPAFSLQFLGEKRLSPKFTLGAGIDANYNSALPIAYEQQDLDQETLTPLRGGLVAHTAYHFGKMEIIAQIGGYVFDIGGIDGIIYNRFGLRHALTEKIKLNLTLRTHFAKADHFELGVVYQFAKK